MSPGDAVQTLRFLSYKTFKRKRSPSDLVLSGDFSPNPWRETKEGQREQSMRQTNTQPGLTGHEPKKVQSQQCDQKRSFGKFFSKRDHEFCPLECPRAVLIGSGALTQNEHGLHPQMSK